METHTLHQKSKNGVADFRDENNFAYVQDSCRDVPWNVSTSKNHTPIQQRRKNYW
jgi:hypothetical protein